MSKIPSNIPPKQPKQPEKIEEAKVKGTADSAETIAASAAASAAASTNAAELRAQLEKVMPNSKSVDRAMELLSAQSKAGIPLSKESVRAAMQEALEKEGLSDDPSDTRLDIGDPWTFLHLNNKAEKRLEAFLSALQDAEFQTELMRSLGEEQAIKEKEQNRRTPGMGKDLI